MIIITNMEDIFFNADILRNIFIWVNNFTCCCRNKFLKQRRKLESSAVLTATNRVIIPKKGR